MRQNAFFAHLSRDIRNMVYNYLDFPPVRSECTNDRVTFMLACHQAKQEAEEEGARQAWIHVRGIQKEFERSNGCKLKLAKSLHPSKDFLGLRTLSLVVSTRPAVMPASSLERVMHLSLNTLRIHFTGDPTWPLGIDLPIRMIHELVVGSSLTRTSRSRRQSTCGFGTLLYRGAIAASNTPHCHAQPTQGDRSPSNSMENGRNFQKRRTGKS
jgi:hypothetical protein